jgi:hypothetical protein
MADSHQQADIRGIDIDKLAKGFGDTEIKLKKFVTVSSTSAREIRWYQKTSGFITGVTTTGITASPIANVAFGARPSVAEQSWTRNTSYVRKYFIESPVIPDEDIKDSDIDILATNIRDLVRAVGNQVAARIFSVLSSGWAIAAIPTVGNFNATSAAWDTASFTGVDIVEDIMEAKMNLEVDGYDSNGAVLLVNAYDYKQIITWLISSKGSSIPSFSSQKVETGVVTELLGCKVVTDETVTVSAALVFVPQRACTWKEFVPITAVAVRDEGIGTKIRVWEEGEAILTDPNAVNLIYATRTAQG